MKNYLRIYGNIGQTVYNETDRKQLVALLTGIAHTLGYTKPKYDISGQGYGISKGDAFLGEKAFNNKLDKKGDQHLEGITVLSSDYLYKSGFALFLLPQHVNRLDMYFSWSPAADELLNGVLVILNKVAEQVKIDYAYAYPADKTLWEEGEWKLTQFRLGGSSLSMPEEERQWQQQLGMITEGTIKKLYPVNVFNKRQQEQLTGVSPLQRIALNHQNEIWII